MVQARVSKTLARQLVAARARLAYRWERIGPVLWDINNLEFLRQTRAAIEIQRVYRGRVGRFRADLRRLQIKLAMFPKVPGGPECNGCWLLVAGCCCYVVDGAWKGEGGGLHDAGGVHGWVGCG